MSQRSQTGEAARWRKRTGDRLTVATLNTRGLAITGSHLRERYRVIAHSFEDNDVDVVTFQEVLSYYHLKLLVKHMPSFRYASFRPSIVGPAGGLATISRLPFTRSHYRSFPLPVGIAGPSYMTRFKAPLKGTLVTRLAQPQVCIVNTHPLANRDGDWSESNRYYPLHKQQLSALSEIIADLNSPLVLCGDFNIARKSTLYRDFVRSTGLADAFDDRCPPTFHTQYLSAGKSPHCIDFIMVTDSIKVEAGDLFFTGKQPMSDGPSYVSDHIGLRARALVPG